MQPNSDERLFATLIFVTSFFTTIIGPIVIWLVKRDSSHYVDYYGKEYFNFIISFFIYSVIAAFSMIILIGFILLPLIGLVAFVLTIIAAIKAYDGVYYRIPFTIRFFH